MGAVLGTLMGGVTMGVTSSALNCICFACPWGSSSVAKYLHIVLLGIFLAIAFFWNHYAQTPLLFPDFSDRVECSPKESAMYFGPYAIITGLFIYHALQGLLLVGVRKQSDTRAIIQNGGWPIKIFALFGCVISAYFVKPSVHVYTFYLAVGSAAVFLALQSVYLVDFAYRGAEFLVERYEESEGELWKYSLFGITGLLYLISILISIVLMIKFPNHLLLAVLNIIVMVVVSVCSVLEEVQEANPQAGIFQAAFISFYNTFLLASSTIHDKSASTMIAGWVGTVSVFGLILFVAGLFYYSATIGVSPDDMTPTTDGGSVEKGTDSITDDVDLEYNMSIFHVYLILAAFYALISITKWRPLKHIDPAASGAKLYKIGESSELMSLWTPVVSSWLLSGLYLWSLFAPMIYPDRDFT